MLYNWFIFVTYICYKWFMMNVLKEHKKIKVRLLRNNSGQFIDRGVPKNPRVINKDNFELLLDSLRESDLTQIRPLDVLQHGDDYVVLSGNQRLRAAKTLKLKEIPCNVLRDDLEPKIYRQIVMQANTNYGEWNHEDLANEWSEDELEMWGYDLPEIDEDELKAEEDLSDKLSDKLAVEIECKTEHELQVIFNEMEERGFKCKILTL